MNTTGQAVGWISGKTFRCSNAYLLTDSRVMYSGEMLAGSGSIGFLLSLNHL